MSILGSDHSKIVKIINLNTFMFAQIFTDFKYQTFNCDLGLKQRNLLNKINFKCLNLY